MNRTDAPKKQPIAFGVNGQRENLPDTTPSGDNTASYDAGFPSVTMIPKSAGGLPPKGQDMNQILYELSNLARWASSGAINSFDSSFSTGIAGYPKGAMLLGTDGTTICISTADANTNNPDVSMTGWITLSDLIGFGAIKKYGAPLIGQLIEWPLQQMPHEIWTDMGQEYIPYMAQSFDPVKYPLLSQLHPTNVLPADMRGYVARGWDNGRGIDTGRVLMSAQGDAIRDITGSFYARSDSAAPVTGAFTKETATQLIGNTASAAIGKINFSAADAGVPTASENRGKNVAWNFIVRAK